MEATHTCERCGSPTANFFPYGPSMVALFGKAGFSYCDECFDHFARVERWRNEQRGKEVLTCPWCGYEDEDSPWEITDDYDEDYKCPRCGRTYWFEREVTVTFNSGRHTKDYPGESSHET